MPSKEIRVTCGCGEAWSETEWAELPSDGRYFAGAEGWLEVRTCVCGARLTIPCDAPSAKNDVRDVGR